MSTHVETADISKIDEQIEFLYNEASGSYEPEEELLLRTIAILEAVRRDANES